jgi:hypothetical protein
MENALEYLDPPEQVADRLREKHRQGAKAAQAGLADHRKAEAERRKALADIRQKYPNPSPNCQILYDAVSPLMADQSIEKIEAALEKWNTLSATDVENILGVWPTDISRVSVLDSDLSYAFSLAGRGPGIRAAIAKLYEALEFEASEQKRIGAQDGLWTIPAASSSEAPKAVVVNTTHDPLRH